MKPPNSTPSPNQVEQPVSMTITTSASSAATTNSTSSLTSSVATNLAFPSTIQAQPLSAPSATTTTTISSSSSPTSNLKQIQTPISASISPTVAIIPGSTLSLQHQPTIGTSQTTTTTTTITTNNVPVTAAALITPQPTIITKPPPVAIPTKSSPLTATPVSNITTATINVITQEQQAPLALTTQSTYRRVQLPQDMHNQQQQQQQQPSTTMSQSVPSTTHLAQIQAKIEPTQLQCGNSIITSSPITLATNSTTPGTTALVIIPQQPTGPSMAPPKMGAMSAKTAHTSTIQMQGPVTTIVPSLASEPLTAHQNTTINQQNMINRPPQTLSVVPMITTVPNPKHEPKKNTCCLIDNGTRCDSVAGNASFNQRIQKLVASKRMNFVLDQTARHSYICDMHKSIITVAKKTTGLTRETKANARNYAANNNSNVSLASQPANNLSDLSMSGQPLPHHHPMNMDMLSKQSRLINNHTNPVMNNIPMRPGAQIAYGHYAHPNQVVPMDTMMATNYDNTGGDNIASGSGGVSVDLQQLQVNTLRRYKKHFRVQTRPGLNKMQLAESLKHHFRTLPIIEKEAITYFVYIVKCSRNKLDHNTKE